MSKETITRITDRVLEGDGRVAEPAARRGLPVVFVDAIVVKIRDGQVANRPIYVAVGGTVDGERDVLGLWAGEGAKYWHHVLTEIKNRGVADVCIVVCDGLTGLPDAVSSVWPRSITQTCVIHLLSVYWPSGARASRAPTGRRFVCQRRGCCLGSAERHVIYPPLPIGSDCAIHNCLGAAYTPARVESQVPPAASQVDYRPYGQRLGALKPRR